MKLDELVENAKPIEREIIQQLREVYFEIIEPLSVKEVYDRKGALISSLVLGAANIISPFVLPCLYIYDNIKGKRPFESEKYSFSTFKSVISFESSLLNCFYYSLKELFSSKQTLCKIRNGEIVHKKHFSDSVGISSESGLSPVLIFENGIELNKDYVNRNFDGHSKYKKCNQFIYAEKQKIEKVRQLTEILYKTRLENQDSL